MATGVLFVFDWDDTIFPTTYRKETVAFEALDKLLHTVMTKCLRYGKVCLVSLGSTKWIERCLQKLPLLKKLKSQLILESARKHVEDKTLESLVMAKKSCFESLWGFHHQPQMLISIGDSEIEKRAAKEFSAENNLIAKTILFNREPTLHNIQIQLSDFLGKIDLLGRLNTNIDLDAMTLGCYGVSVSQNISKSQRTRDAVYKLEF